MQIVEEDRPGQEEVQVGAGEWGGVKYATAQNCVIV